MLDKCAEACARQAEVDTKQAVKIVSKIAHIETFFDLEAEDIEKNVISFDKFKSARGSRWGVVYATPHCDVRQQTTSLRC